MKKQVLSILVVAAFTSSLHAQGLLNRKANTDTTVRYAKPEEVTEFDTIPTYKLSDVNVIAFKTSEEQMKYYKYKSRIIKVLPYVKIAKQLYAELQEKEDNSRKREYRHYRKDVEKEMRTKFENELKNLTTGQGEMLFKLINRETGNNAYKIIKELKGGFTAWFYQLVGKRYGYDLKDDYDPSKEQMIEYIIKELGTSYNV
jgi:hypothetical protein